MFFACKRIEKIEGISVVSLITQIIVGGIIFLILVSIYFIITRDELFSSMDRFKTAHQTPQVGRISR